MHNLQQIYRDLFVFLLTYSCSALLRKRRPLVVRFRNFDLTVLVTHAREKQYVPYRLISLNYCSKVKNNASILLPLYQ